MTTFEATVSAVCYSIVEERCPRAGDEEFPQNRVVAFVIGQIKRSPDYLRPPLKLLTLVFDWAAIVRRGRPFHRLEHTARWQHVERLRRSRFGVKRDLIRFFESLVIFAWHSYSNDRNQ